MASNKKLEPMTKQDIAWRDKTFNKREQEVCHEIWGGIPLYDEYFIRSDKQFILKTDGK